MGGCPRCGHVVCVKDGFVEKRQRFQCKSCHYRYSVAERGAGSLKKKQALQLYLEGLGFRFIGRFLGVSHVTVYQWIRAMGSAVSALHSDAKIDVVEMDEMYTYIGSKKLLLGLDFC